ncbi:MAG: MBL fold metallo-hydrolase [Saprospiraceae bacterium]|nr:MBL fold metallo-hydrolase [Saprospiraceae bacterium]
MKSFLFLALLCFSQLLLAQANMDDATITTLKINDHMHLLQWSGAGNMMLLSGKDGNILIDDQFAPLSQKINAAAQAIQPGPIKFLFNTHYHGDHTGGNENFGKMGATIIAHDNVRARLTADQRIINFTQPQKAAPEAAWPVITFADGLNVHLNGEDIVIFHVDHAHTDGDALYYFPKSNVLHTGDCFMKGRFPFIDRNSGGSVDGWLSGVSRAITMIDDETVIIPGHGDLANKKDYREVRDAVMSIRDAIKMKIKAGMDLDQIKTAKITSALDATMGSGFIKSDAFITTIYNELTGEK